MNDDWQGTHRVFKDLTVGSSSAGTFNMYGGTLEVGSTDIPECELMVGGSAKGFFNQGEDGADEPVPSSVTVHGNLVVDGKEGGAYFLRSGLLQTDNTFVGRTGQGSFNQYGGIHRVGVDATGELEYGNHFLTLGRDYGSQGSYFMTDGLLEVGLEIVGSDGGHGAFYQTGGKHNVLQSLFVGFGSEGGQSGIGSFSLDGEAQANIANGVSIGTDGGTGSLRVGGSATLSTSDQIVVGAHSTAAQDRPSNGVVYQGYDSGLNAEKSSSSVSAGQLILGRDKLGTGTYKLHSGTLQTRAETIGGEGAATFTQTGGSNTADSMTIGSRGEYAFKGGSLDVGTLVNNGLFQGSGSITVDSFTNFGTLAPGSSPGTLAIEGDFTQDELGILQIEIGGTGPTLFDFLDISGTATLGGTLEILQWQGFTPAIGNSFDIIKAADIDIMEDIFKIVGTPGAGLMWTAMIVPGGLSGTDTHDILRLTASAVPIPGAAWLLGPALLGLAGLRRKRAA